MKEMVERVATGIAKEIGLILNGTVPVPLSERVARAAIEAMRQPTRAMIAAADVDEADIDVDVEDVWVSMIDESLR